MSTTLESLTSGVYRERERERGRGREKEEVTWWGRAGRPEVRR